MKQESFRLAMAALAAVLSCAGGAKLGAQAEAAQLTQNDTQECPVRFRIPAGQGIHQTLLYLETGEAQSGTSFTLYGPGQTTGTVINPGTAVVPNMYSFSYTVVVVENSDVKFHQTATAGSYVLRIRHAPLGTYTAVGAEETWVLRATGIADSGSHTVNAYVGSQTAADYLGNPNPPRTAVTTTQVMINQPPQLSNLSPADGSALLECRGETFSATEQFADLAPLTRTWDFGDSTTSSAAAPTHAYTGITSDLTRTVTLTLSETLLASADHGNIAQGAAGQVGLTVNANPVPAVSIQKKLPADADFSDAPATMYVPVGTQVQFRASVTDDARDTLNKTWTLPDAATPSGDNADFTFNAASCTAVDVALQATDLCAQSGNDTVGIVAKSLPNAVIAVLDPATSLGADPYGDVPLPRTFSAGNSTDACGESLSYNWQVDTVPPATGTNVALRQDFLVPGTYTVGLRATDPHDISGGASVQVYALPNESIRFPAHIGVPYDGDPPAVDGEARRDTGWRGALRLAYAGGTYPLLVFQGLRHRSQEYLYLSFEIRGDVAPNQYDVVVIGIRPASQKMAAGPAATDRLIRVHPFGASGNPEIEFLQGTGAAWQPGGAPTAAADDAAAGYRLAVSPAADDVSPKWTVELRLPTGAATGWIAIPQDFLFYFNVFQSLTNAADPPLAEYSFPRSSPDVAGPPDLASQAFLPRWWGKADRSGTALARGVWFRDWSDVGTTSADPEDTAAPLASVFSFDQDNPAANTVVNTIVARVHNDSAEEVLQGTGVALEPRIAEQVRVRFRIANWGVPGAGDWSEIEEDTGSANPTAYEDVPAGQVDPGNAENILPHDEAYSMRWTLDQAEIDRYTTVQGDDQFNEAHQCILAEIESRGDTDIVAASVHRNMNFQGASRFRHKALISTRGAGAAPQGREAHRILLIVTPNSWKREPEPATAVARGAAVDAAAAVPAGLPLHPARQTRAPEGYLQWVVNAYRYTDRTLVIDGKEHTLVEPMGSFGYLVRHEGFVQSWKQAIQDAQQDQENLYTLEIPPESAKAIGIRIRARDYPWFASQRGGYARAAGAFAADFGNGAYLHADLGYEMWERLFLLGRVGYCYFPALLAGQDPAAGASLSLSPGFTIPLRWPFSLAVAGGLGAYFPANGGPLLSLNAVLGADWRPLRHLSVQLETGCQAALGGGPIFLYAGAGLVQRF